MSEKNVQNNLKIVGHKFGQFKFSFTHSLTKYLYSYKYTRLLLTYGQEKSCRVWI